MKIGSILLATFSLTLLLSSCCCVGDVDRNWSSYRNEFEKSYAIQTPASVTIKNIDGFVHVNTWDKNEVRINGVISLKAENQEQALKRMKQIEVLISHEDKSISIRVERKRGGEVSRFWHMPSGWRVDLEVLVPRESNLSITNVDGPVRVASLKGTEKVSTVDGSIDVRDVEGSVACNTVDGSCSIIGVRGNVDVRTTDGTIRVEGVLSDLKAETVDGSIHIAALEGSTVAKEWKLSNVGGSVTLGLPEEFSANFDASSVSGRISIGIPAQVQTLSHRRVKAVLGEGGGLISISTTDGSIRIGTTTAGEKESEGQGTET